MFKRRVQQFFLFSFLLSLFFGTLYLGAAYNADPLYIFHSPKAAERERLSTETAIPLAANMRLQAFGIINNYQFDSVILGTSELENTSSKVCNREIGGTFINLSMSGSSFHERRIVLNYLLQKMPIKNIIYSLDMYYFACEITGQDYALDNWDFLYDTQVSSVLRKLSIYMNKRSMRLVLGYDKARDTTPDRPNAWMTQQSQMIRFGGLDNWIRDQNDPVTGKFLHMLLPRIADLALAHRKEKTVSNAEQLKTAEEYIYKNIFSYIKDAPQTKFYLVFPPYWRFTYAEWRQTDPARFALHQDVIRYVVSQAQLLKNVEIYGFEDCDFVNDIKIYKDTVHYHPSINDYIIKSIGSGRHKLTSDNVESYLEHCEKLASAFDLQGLAAEVAVRLAADK